MLKIDQLNTFLEEAKIKIPAVTDFKIMAGEDRYARFARSVAYEEDKVFLIALIPSARVTTKDKDNTRFGNNLSFMMIRKLDTKAGDDAYTAAFTIAQEAILALFGMLHDKTDNFGEDCTFRHLDLDSSIILPVENFHQTNGWDLSIRLRTNYKK